MGNNITIKNDYSSIILHEVIAIQAKIDALTEVLLGISLLKIY